MEAKWLLVMRGELIKGEDEGRERGRGRDARDGRGERIRVQTGPGPYDFFISSGRISAPNERVKGVRSTK